MEIAEPDSLMDAPSPATRWQGHPPSFQQEKEVLLQIRSSLQKERSSLHQERLFYKQNWLCLVQQILADPQRKIQGERLQQRLRDTQEFTDVLSRQRDGFRLIRQAFLERFAALREQRLLVREMADFQQKQEGFRLLQAAYRELQQQLREEQQRWHEQSICYRQQRLDRQADLHYLRATKAFTR